MTNARYDEFQLSNRHRIAFQTLIIVMALTNDERVHKKLLRRMGATSSRNARVNLRSDDVFCVDVNR